MCVFAALIYSRTKNGMASIPRQCPACTTLIWCWFPGPNAGMPIPLLLQSCSICCFRSHWNSATALYVVTLITVSTKVLVQDMWFCSLDILLFSSGNSHHYQHKTSSRGNWLTHTYSSGIHTSSELWIQHEQSSKFPMAHKFPWEYDILFFMNAFLFSAWEYGTQVLNECLYFQHALKHVQPNNSVPFPTWIG